MRKIRNHFVSSWVGSINPTQPATDPTRVRCSSRPASNIHLCADRPVRASRPQSAPPSSVVSTHVSLAIITGFPCRRSRQAASALSCWPVPTVSAMHAL
jgi:hypothetical protein